MIEILYKISVDSINRSENKETLEEEWVCFEE